MSATPDFFRMTGAKLRWAATKGPKANRQLAQAEIDRRAGKRESKPTKVAAKVAPTQAPAVGVTRIGDDLFAGIVVTPAMWAQMDALTRSV